MFQFRQAVFQSIAAQGNRWDGVYGGTQPVGVAIRPIRSIQREISQRGNELAKWQV
jgi:hypothetical protein